MLYITATQKMNGATEQTILEKKKHDNDGETELTAALAFALHEYRPLYRSCKVVTRVGVEEDQTSYHNVA